MAEQRVGHDGVEGPGREVERVHVADDELDAVADAVVGGEPLAGGDELRTLVDPGDRSAEPVAGGDRARHDARAAAEVQHGCVRGRSMSFR